MPILDRNHVEYDNIHRPAHFAVPICIAAGMACKRRLNDKRLAAVSCARNIRFMPYMIIVYYTLDFTPFREYRMCICECVGVWCTMYAGMCMQCGDRDDVDGAGEQMTLTAGRNNLAAATSRSIHRSRLRERSRPKNTDKIDKKR